MMMMLSWKTVQRLIKFPKSYVIPNSYSPKDLNGIVPYIS